MKNKFDFINNNLDLFPISANGWALVVLEAWRRGLEVSLGVNSEYVISSKTKSQKFRLSRLAGSIEAAEAIRICNDKSTTKEYLSASGVPTPKGFKFIDDISYKLVAKKANEIGYPVCLKANGWSKGKGVYPHISNDVELEKFYSILIDKLGCKSVCLEKFISGDDFRVYVVGGKVSAALKRVPANVEGNGYESIQELINSKNIIRSKNPFLRNSLIRADDDVLDKLSGQGLSLSSVPEAGLRVYLRDKSNASAGGDTIDVTECISDKNKSIAVDAINAIPGLSHGGVDIISNDITSEDPKSYSIEINQAAELGVNIFPSSGKVRHVYKDIVSYYFPETLDVSTSLYSNLYFNLKSPLGLIKSKAAKMVTIPNRPDISKYQFFDVAITAGVKSKEFKKVIIGPALKYAVNGMVRMVGNGTVQMKIAGYTKNIQSYLKSLEVNPNVIISCNTIDSFELVMGFYIAESSEFSISDFVVKK